MDNKEKVYYAIHSVPMSTYSYPENGDYTEDVSKVPPLTLEIMEYVELDPNMLINVEKTLELINQPPKRETYISPFTGRVM